MEDDFLYKGDGTMSTEQIMPCPYCNQPCHLYGSPSKTKVECSGCDYSSPIDSARKAITAHNDLCRLVQRGRECQWRGPDERPEDGQLIMFEIYDPDYLVGVFIGKGVEVPQEDRHGDAPWSMFVPWNRVARWMPWPGHEETPLEAAL